MVSDEEIISLSHAKVDIFFRFCIMPWKDERQNPQSNVAWEDKLTWFKSPSQYRTLDTTDGEPMEFEWNIFTGFTTLQLCYKVQEFLSKMSIQPEDFTGRIIFMSMFHDISWRSKGNKQEWELSASLVSFYAKRFSPGRWSFLGLGSEKKWYSTLECKPQGEWDRVAQLMMIKFGESGHPVFRATGPLSRGTLKSKVGGKLSLHFCADEGTIETVFRTLISVNHLSLYGAVSDLCDECKSCHVRTGRLVLVGQSDPLFNDTLLADVHFWNYQGREVSVCSMIDEATRFHVTQILPSQSVRDLYEAIMTAWVKWAELHVFCCLSLTDRTWLVSSLSNWERKVRLFSWELQKLHGSCGTPWSICSIHGGEDGSWWSA